jgi:hypothetical protein
MVGALGLTLQLLVRGYIVTLDDELLDDFHFLAGIAAWLFEECRQVVTGDRL